MKKFNRVLAPICCAALLMSLSMSAASTTNVVPNPIDSELVPFDASEVEYISFSEYLEKYGEDNVLQGFTEAAAVNRTELMRVSGEDSSTYNTRSLQAEAVLDAEDLFQNLSDGEFLGLEVFGVSDLEPNDPNFMIWVDDSAFPAHDMAVPDMSDSLSAYSSATRTTTYPHKYRGTENYAVFYSLGEVDYLSPNFPYEPLAGTYFYKYSWPDYYNYLGHAHLSFDDTHLYGGTQSKNMVAYIAAISQSSVVDFGLIANPDASNRNAGLYVCYNPSNVLGMFTEALPAISSTMSDGVMEIGSAAIDLYISVGEISDTQHHNKVMMEAVVNNETVFYHEYGLNGMTAGSNNLISFMEGMSCYSADGGTTNTASGSCFTNVTFTTQYYNLDGVHNLSLCGPDTYYAIVAKPQWISIEYTDTDTKLAIQYGQE